MYAARIVVDIILPRLLRHAFTPGCRRRHACFILLLRRLSPRRLHFHVIAITYIVCWLPSFTTDIVGSLRH